MAVQSFAMTRDINGYNTFTIDFPNKAFNFTLEADEEKTVTVPSTGNPIYKGLIAIFSFTPGTMVWVAKNEEAQLPTDSVTATNTEGNPSSRYVNAGDVLSFKTHDTSTEIGVRFDAVYK